MTLTQLLYFCSVARTGSYTRAAGEFNVSEPVVHRALKSLEKSCGAKLLERQPHGVSLTKAGGALFAYASQIGSLTQQAEQAMTEERGLVSGEIVIGAGTNVAVHLLPHILGKWMVDHPRVDIKIRVGLGLDNLKLLIDDRLDMILTPNRESGPGLKRQLIFADSLLAVAAPAHKATNSSFIAIGDLTRERIILSPRDSAIRQKIEEVEHTYGVKFTKVMEVNNQDAIKEFCRAGVGIAVLPRATVAEEIGENKLRVLNAEAFPLSYPYFLLYKSSRSLTPEMRSLLTAVSRWVDETNRGGSARTLGASSNRRSEFERLQATTSGLWRSVSGWIRSVREECLDHLVILHEHHLQRVLVEYRDHFNHRRPHQGLNQQCPVPAVQHSGKNRVHRRDVLGGIIHDYYRDAA
ncbi:MAG: LysR substrate-binding domain-containing protein [Chloroflexota bacterium]